MTVSRPKLFLERWSADKVRIGNAEVERKSSSKLRIEFCSWVLVGKYNFPFSKFFSRFRSACSLLYWRPTGFSFLMLNLNRSDYHPRPRLIFQNIATSASAMTLGSVLLQRFHLWSLKWVFARSHIKSRHLGESLSCSLYTELGWLYAYRWWGQFANVAIFPVWAVCRCWLYAQMAPLQENLVISPCFFRFILNFYVAAAARPGPGAGDRSIS